MRVEARLLKKGRIDGRGVNENVGTIRIIPIWKHYIFLYCINLLPIFGRLWTEENAVVLFGKIKFLINFSFHSSER